MGALEVAPSVGQWVDPMEVPLEVPLEVQMGHHLGGLEMVQKEGLSVLVVVLKAQVDRMVPVMEGRFRFLP